MGRSGGGRSGGGHSGGFSGGGRSFGGFSGGGGHGRSGGRSGGFRPGGPGGPGMPPPRWHRPRVYGGGSFWPFMAGFGLGRGTGGGSSSNGSGNNAGNGGGCAGCAGIFVAIIALMIVLALLGGLATQLTSCAAGGFDTDIAASTVEREKLPASASATALSRHYDDEDGGWIYDANTIERGMERFYDETGVQPYVVILPNGSETSTTALSERAQQLYDEVFDDEAGFLLVFCDDGDGSFNCGYAVGSQAKTVMDDEAVGILADYLDRYYQDYSISEEEIFANAFEDAGERIMNRTTSPVVYVAVCAAVVVVAGLIFFGVKGYRASKEREAKRMQDVLNTPLETFGDEDLEDLERKYQKPKE